MLRFEDELEALRENDLLRNLRPVQSAQGTVVLLDGREVVSFASNDYLGLANSELLKHSAKIAIEEFGMGSGASRLVCGSLAPHVLLEKELAKFKSTEAALVFS